MTRSAVQPRFQAHITNKNMKNKNNKNEIKHIADFLFEIGSLKRMRRNGYQHLGSDFGTIAEHSFRVAMIGYVLAKMEKADEHKIMKMCLFHDIQETRTGDLNMINRRYSKAFEEKAIKDQCQNLSFGKEIINLFAEFKEKKTKEAILTKEADTLDQLLTEKESFDIGNPQAKDWMKFSETRLKTKVGKQLAKQIVKSRMKDWWWDWVVK